MANKKTAGVIMMGTHQSRPDSSMPSPISSSAFRSNPIMFIALGTRVRRWKLSIMHTVVSRTSIETETAPIPHPRMK